MSLQTIGCKMDHFVSQDFTWIFSNKKIEPKPPPYFPSLFYPIPAGSCLSFLHLPCALRGDWTKTLCHMSTCSVSTRKPFAFFNGNHSPNLPPVFRGSGGQTWCRLFLGDHFRTSKNAKKKTSNKILNKCAS